MEQGTESSIVSLLPTVENEAYHHKLCHDFVNVEDRITWFVVDLGFRDPLITSSNRYLQGFDGGRNIAQKRIQNKVKKKIPMSHLTFMHELKALLSIRK